MSKLNSIGISKEPKNTLVVVAMSGGVDSSTVAAMMKSDGYNVIGITLKLYNDNKETASSKQCCAGQDIMDAKRVADKLKIKHKILYYQDKFKEGVIDNFIDSYLNGETPIPCVQCNKTVKFKDLFDEAKRLKADALVTGHYVKSITEENNTDMYRGIDLNRSKLFLIQHHKRSIKFFEVSIGKSS
jgi:tRNA-specific 2-thiouridylase